MADNLTLRKEVSTLQPTELAALRDAYQQMMAISEADNRGWIYWSEYHGYNRNDCWHHGILGLGTQQTYNLFLPWHRAYLLYFEHTCRDRNAAVALPWWDWTSSASHSSGIPAAFTAPTAGGAANPLLHGPVPAIQGDPARRTTRSPGSTHGLPTAAQVAHLIKLGSFVDFSTQLEDFHDQIHGWVGGDMGVVNTAAFDPIFWAHHCMIDRIWYLWQIQNGNASIPQNYLNKPLAPWGLTVADVLDIRVLGYEYAASGVSASGNGGLSTSGTGSSGAAIGTTGTTSPTATGAGGTLIPDRSLVASADDGSSSDDGSIAIDSSPDTGASGTQIA